MENSRIQRLGKPYIETHCSLRYDSFGESWEVSISENDFFNNLRKNPEKEIPLKFYGIEVGTGREVYRGIDDERYYLREVSTHENFAKWYVCGKKRVFEDGDEPRPNLIFVLGDQKERIRYDDWNGVAAYSDTFNPNFRT